jgi:hypothetical protein
MSTASMQAKDILVSTMSLVHKTLSKLTLWYVRNGLHVILVLLHDVHKTCSCIYQHVIRQQALSMHSS